MGVIAVVNAVWIMAMDYDGDDSRVVMIGAVVNVGIVNITGDCGENDFAPVTMATGNIDPMQGNEKPKKFRRLTCKKCWP